MQRRDLYPGHKVRLRCTCTTEFAFAACRQAHHHVQLSNILVDKFLDGKAPFYLADICIPVGTVPVRQQFRSAALVSCQIPTLVTDVHCRCLCCGVC